MNELNLRYRFCWHMMVMLVIERSDQWTVTS